MKCTIFWWKRGAIWTVINEMKNDWMKSKTSEEKSRMIKRARLNRNITIAGYCLILTMIVTLNGLPYLGFTIRYITNLTDPGTKHLPAQSRYFYDITRTWSFRLTFILQAISLTFAGTYYTGVDLFCAHLTLHVCGQLENLALHLTRLCNLKNIRLRLAFCVNEHVRLIRFVHTVDNAVNFMLLGQLFIFTVLFCFQGFLFVTVIKEGGDLPVFRFMWLSGAILAILSHMFIYCFVGEILALCCEGMYEAAYNNEWYILKPHEAKMLLLILIRALYVTAGKMFPMTMAMFCGVIKTSVSYVSVLLAYS